MLKPKDIQFDETGAVGLAEMMAVYTTGMDVTHVDLQRLHDAPEGWNFFKPLPEEKFAELCESIAENGLIHPVIAYEDVYGRYVLLSGHNRKRAYEYLYEATADDRYSRIACVLKRGIDEDEARSLLVDANWVQRSLTPSERAKAILYKYANMGRKPRDEQGSGKRTYDLVAEHFGLKATQVYQYTKLAGLPDEWLAQVDEGKLSIKAAVYLAGLDADMRQDVLYFCANRPTTELVKRWRDKSSGRERIRTLKRDVPEDLYSELMDMIDARVMEYYKTLGQ